MTEAQGESSLRLSGSSALWTIGGQLVIQGLRFAAKAAVVIAATAPHYGLVAALGIASFLLASLATLGLDQAAIRAKSLAPGWTKSARRAQLLAGCLAAGVMAALAAFDGGTSAPEWRWACFGMAPSLILGAAACLPMARLVRTQRLRAVLFIDIISILGLAAGVALGLQLGYGAAALIWGWNLQALWNWVACEWAARHHQLPEETGGESFRASLQFGWPVAMTAFLMIGIERLELALATWYGDLARTLPSATGPEFDPSTRLAHYEWSQSVAWMGVALAAAIIDRWGFPWLARHRAIAGLRGLAGPAWALLFNWVVPAYLGLAVLNQILVPRIEEGLHSSWIGLSSSILGQCFNAFSQIALLVGFALLRAASLSLITTRLSLLLGVGLAMAFLGALALREGLPFPFIHLVPWLAGVARLGTAALATLLCLRQMGAPGGFSARSWPAVTLATATAMIAATSRGSPIFPADSPSAGLAIAAASLPLLVTIAARWAIDRRQLKTEWNFLWRESRVLLGKPAS